MAGTKAGGQKAAATNKKKHGKEFYAEIGAKGGRNGTTGGFYVDDRTWFQKLLRRPTRAQRAGKLGGQRSKRRKPEVVDG